MTDQEPTALQVALEQIGRDLHNAFADAGMRITAQTALGQIMSGSPDVAAGMIGKLSDEQRLSLADAAFKLHEMSYDGTAEGRSAAEQAEAERTSNTGRAISLAGTYASALRGRHDEMSARLDHANTADLLWLQRASRVLAAAVDARLPAGLGVDHAFMPADMSAPEHGTCQHDGCTLRWAKHPASVVAR